MKPTLLIFLLLPCTFLNVAAQKIIGDCTLEYRISGNNIATAKNFFGKKIVYLKGKQIRVDMISTSFTQTFIYNYNTGSGAILKEIGSEKYLQEVDEAALQKQNAQYKNLKLETVIETKKILGYTCNKMIATLSDESEFVLYYTPDLQPVATENPFQFRNVPGLVLEYESGKGQSLIKYSATSINFNPVPALKFTIPSSGYRKLEN